MTHINGGRLWDLTSSALISHFFAPGESGIMASALSPDGRFTATSIENDIILWRLEASALEELLDWIAENRYVRKLT